VKKVASDRDAKIIAAREAEAAAAAVEMGAEMVVETGAGGASMDIIDAGPDDSDDLA